MDAASTPEEIELFVRKHLVINDEETELIVEDLMEKKALESAKEYMFVTINPKEEVDDLDTLIELMKKLFKYKPIADLPMIYAYDQRGQSMDDIHGLHIHLVLSRKRVTDGKGFIVTNIYSLADSRAFFSIRSSTINSVSSSLRTKCYREPY